jgi:anti-sigma factor RsiW
MTHDDSVASVAAEGYLLDELSDAERDEFEEHYADCDECFAALISAMRFILGLRDGTRER